MRKEKYLSTWACPAGNLCKTRIPQQPGRSSTESRSSWGLPCLSLKVCSPSPQQRAQGNEKPNTVGVTNTISLEDTAVEKGCAASTWGAGPDAEREVLAHLHSPKAQPSCHSSSSEQGLPKTSQLEMF